MMMKIVIFALFAALASGFMMAPKVAGKHTKINMADGETFNPRNEAGVSGPLGYFDPLNLAPTDKRGFKKFQEAELKHGRVAMLAVLGILIGEKAPFILGSEISGPAIYHFQQASDVLNAWIPNVVGFILAVEGFNIIKGWESPSETNASGDNIASLKSDYVNGDLKFDPLGLTPKTKDGFKSLRTKELNNGRLAMISAFGLIVQELVSGAPSV